MIKKKSTYSRKEIALLCEQATHQDEVISKFAVHRLFSDVVEGLCDSFSLRKISLYDRIFTQVIDYCRHLPDGKDLDRLLKRFELPNERGMLARKKRVEKLRKFSLADRKKIKKICVLSRITVGADVAVTSVVLSKLRRVFPGINIVVIGPRKLEEVFGGHPDMKVREVPYVRRGGLLGRLNAWCDLVRVIDEERRNLGVGEFLVIDPDSRLTQLGLLPVVPQDKGYFFFQSRTYAKARSGRIGELTANWLDEVFGAGIQKTYPEIFIDKNVLLAGRACVQNLSCSGRRRVVCINFGVGGNEKKRVSAAFEDRLVKSLLKQGFAVILDKGFGDEVEQMNRLIAKLKSGGNVILDVNEKNILKMSHQGAWSGDVLTWEGGLAGFGALIASSHVYIGYDSGFQHIASAQGVPIIDVFLGAPSALFVKRWTPYGKNTVKIMGGWNVNKTSVTPERILDILKNLLLDKP